MCSPISRESSAGSTPWRSRSRRASSALAGAGRSVVVEDEVATVVETSWRDVLVVEVEMTVAGACDSGSPPHPEPRTEASRHPAAMPVVDR